MTSIDRALALLLALSDGKSVTASALALRFGVSLRTIYRDVDRLLSLGVPVEADRGAQGGYRLSEGYLQPPVGLTRNETAALLVALAVVRGVKATPFERDLESAEKKLLASLPGPARALLKDGGRIVAVEPAPDDVFHWEKPVEAPLDGGPAVNGFLEGILKSRRVRLVYENPYRGTVREHEIEPGGILFDRDKWYLIGRSLDHSEERIWRADKARAITLSGMAFKPDRAFDVRRYLGRAWLKAAMKRWMTEDERNVSRIRMSAGLAQTLKHDWFYTHAHFEDEGQDRVLMTVPETDPRAILPLARWLGPEAELLHPPELRRALAAESQAMADSHKDG